MDTAPKVTWPLSVDGRPFIAVGGEVHNSSSSDGRHLTGVWERLARVGINTVLVSVAWAEVERSEGEFDFAIVDELVREGREHGLRLGVIWFGAFKNALSTYAPTWVRADSGRFPRAVLQQDPLPTPFSYPGSTNKPALSVFSPELAQADARAFAALVEHLEEIDPVGTVIMLQVENEIGLLGSARDHSALALSAWDDAVPDIILELARTDPDALPHDVASAVIGAARGATWSQLDANADEVAETFMAWAFASYVERVAGPIRTATRIPFYTNAWLGPQPGQDRPGQYPSGGPTARMLGLWQAVAPSLDWVSPDIYVEDSAPVLATYAQRGNPLFVPESRFSAGDLFLAVGALGAIGYCAFGVEDGRDDARFFEAARTLLALSPLITQERPRGNVWGFALDSGVDYVEHRFGDITLTVRNAPDLFARMLLDVGVELPQPAPSPSETQPGAIPVPGDDRPFGLIIQTGPDRFIVAGQAALFDFTADDGIIEIDEVRELVLDAGELRPSRYLNGDERLAIVPQRGIGIAEITLLRITHA